MTSSPVPQHFAALLLLAVASYGSPAVAFMTPHPHVHSESVQISGHRSLQAEKSAFITDIHAKYGQNNQISATRLHLFGNLFGNEVEEDQKDLEEGELARFSHLVPSDANPKVKFDSLSIMISEWSKLLTDEEKDMGLTTPVKAVALNPQTNDLGDTDVSDYTGVQLLFVKGKTGGRSAYQDKDDEKTKDKKEEDTIKEGGIEVRVEQLSNGDLQVIASRCEIEEGTIIKEMSEQTIVDSLRRAVAAWKKEQGA